PYFPEIIAGQGAPPFSSDPIINHECFRVGGKSSEEAAAGRPAGMPQACRTRQRRTRVGVEVEKSNLTRLCERDKSQRIPIRGPRRVCLGYVIRSLCLRGPSILRD